MADLMQRHSVVSGLLELTNPYSGLFGKGALKRQAVIWSIQTESE